MTKRLITFMLFLVLVVLCFPASGHAQGPTFNYRKVPTAVINNQTLAAPRSFTRNDIQGYGLLVIYVDHSAHNTLTKLAMACTATNDGGTTDFELQDCTLAAGDCDSADASWTKGSVLSPIAGVKKWPWRVDITGFEEVTCTFTPTTGSATDYLTVEIAMITK